MQIAVMPSLQIRDLPEALYQRIAAAARTEHRSLAQQAVAELERALAWPASGRRDDVLQQLRSSQARLPVDAPAPETLVREDRELR